MLQDFFKLVQYIENSATALRCLGPPQIVVILLRMTFIIGQTFFIFKSHKVRQVRIGAGIIKSYAEKRLQVALLSQRGRAMLCVCQ